MALCCYQFNDGGQKRRNNSGEWIGLQNPGPTSNLPLEAVISITYRSLPSFLALGLMQVMPEVLLPICI